MEPCDIESADSLMNLYSQIFNYKKFLQVNLVALGISTILSLTGQCPKVLEDFRVRKRVEKWQFLTNLVKFALKKVLFCLYQNVTFGHSPVKKGLSNGDENKFV